MAAGAADEVPGVLIARGLAEETGKRIRLTHQGDRRCDVEGALGSGRRDVRRRVRHPTRRSIMIGANDITALNGIRPSARRLGAAVQRLRASGAVVVVGTCPDFGVITAIPQPLR